jgi:3-oxoacyl-[acyl-carrier protein] reductase
MRRKNVAIIGGAAGIGKDIALSFGKNGNKVAVVDINNQALEKMLIESGLKEYLFPFQADVSSWDSVNHISQKIKNTIGNVDILIYSAGITKRLRFDEIDWNTWKKTIAVNLHGLFYCIKAFNPTIQSNGSIIIIGSGSAVTGSGGGIHYASSKGGAVGLMKSLVTDLGKRGININVISPRVIESDMLDTLYPTDDLKNQLRADIPIGRLGNPADITSAVNYLSSEQAKYIHGQVILLDGGRTYKSTI